MSHNRSEVGDNNTARRPETGVHNRQMCFCPMMDHYTPEELITMCDYCGAFSTRCCQHPEYCHNFKIIFTDGATLSNGQIGAASGLGVAVGESAATQRWSIPVTDSLDPGQKRSSQRAELLAAIEGLRCMKEMQDEHLGVEKHRPSDPRAAWVITTDSVYVFQGMTEWLPMWKANGLKTAQGRRPSNLDLFMKLDEEILRLERARPLKIGFWRIPRELNSCADALAKEAARQASIAATRAGFSTGVTY